MRSAIFVGVLIFAVIVGGFLFFRKASKKTTGIVHPTPPSLTQPAPPPVQPNNAENEKLRSAIVRKGEGIEHSLFRQLIASPKDFGFTGDTGDDASIRKWAGREAHLLAIRAGYVDWKFGAEVRVRHPDLVAYVLETDGSDLRINQRAVTASDGNATDPSPRTEKVQSISIAGSYQQATFLGNPGSERFIPQFEYLYTGETG